MPLFVSIYNNWTLNGQGYTVGLFFFFVCFPRARLSKPENGVSEKPSALWTEHTVPSLLCGSQSGLQDGLCRGICPDVLFYGPLENQETDTTAQSILVLRSSQCGGGAVCCSSSRRCFFYNIFTSPAVADLVGKPMPSKSYSTCELQLPSSHTIKYGISLETYPERSVVHQNFGCIGWMVSKSHDDQEKHGVISVDICGFGGQNNWVC